VATTTQLPAERFVTTSDEYAISVAKTEYRDGYNSADVDRLLSVFSDSFSNMSDGEPSFYGTEGKEAQRSQAAKLFREYHVKMEIIVIAITVLGNTAYDYGWQKLTLTPKSGGQAEIRRCRYCEIWQKQANGEWKIGFFISNKDLEPVMLEGTGIGSSGDRAIG
jgi:ketosteroid isomerase-like protein